MFSHFIYTNSVLCNNATHTSLWHNKKYKILVCPETPVQGRNISGDKAYILTVLTLAQWEGDHERAEEDAAEGEGLQEGRGGATRQERYRGLPG